MISKNIGYMICETAATAEPNGKIVSQSNRDGRAVIETILQDTEVKNRNGRFYSDPEMDKGLKAKRLTELVESGNLYSENGHPMSKDIARQQIIDPNNLACKIIKYWKEGTDIKAHVKGAPGSIGDDFNEAILDGSKPSFSLRALGTINNTRRGAEVENITIITWDRVIFPSHERAYMTKMVNISESANAGTQYGNQLILDKDDTGFISPITNEKIMDYIKSESANIKTVMESFEMLYENVSLVDKGRRVQLMTKEGSLFVVNLESYIHDEIMNYCSK